MNNTLAKKHKHKYVTTTIYKQKDKKHEDGKHIKIKTMKCTVKGCKQKVTIKSEENHNWRNYKKTSKKSKHTKYCLGCFKEK